MPSDAPPPAEPPGGSLAPLDRAALERVLARATELQAKLADTPDELTEKQLLELGGRGRDLRRSPSPGTGRGANASGAAGGDRRGRLMVRFDHRRCVTRGSRNAERSPVPASIRGCRSQELLRVRRRIGERLTWEARRDFMGSMQASFNLGGRPYALTPANEVGATAVAVDATRVLVRARAPTSRRAGAERALGRRDRWPRRDVRRECRGAGVAVGGTGRARDRRRRGQHLDRRRRPDRRGGGAGTAPQGRSAASWRWNRSSIGSSTARFDRRGRR